MSSTTGNGVSSKPCSAKQRLSEQLQRIAQATGVSDDSWDPAVVAQQIRDVASKLDALHASAKSSCAASAEDIERLERSYQASPSGPAPTQRLTKKQRRAAGQRREFDASTRAQRFVALEVMYIGWGYQGFARQANSDNTIEGHLFAALRRTRLIPPSADPCELGYSRCGRTDKGVSALGQVVALRLRSAAVAGCELPPAAAELDYPLLLNRALPHDIRVLGWADISDGFNARFSAMHRTYKYFFVHDGSLDVAAMRSAVAHLLGEHDFRNFCKADVSQVRNFVRTVLEARLEDGSNGGDGGSSGSGTSSGGGGDGNGSGTSGGNGNGNGNGADAGGADGSSSSSSREGAAALAAGTGGPGCTSAQGARATGGTGIGSSSSSGGGGSGATGGGGYSILVLHIRGSAFLYHQVRYIAAVLLLVGQGLEQPGVVRQLLDVAAAPAKPQYVLAPEAPLLLYECGFEGLAWRRSPALLARNLAEVGDMLRGRMEAAALLRVVHQRLVADAHAACSSGDREGAGGGESGGEASQLRPCSAAQQQERWRQQQLQAHVPLLKRATEPSLEERFAKAGIPLELLNQRGGQAVVDAGD